MPVAGAGPLEAATVSGAAAAAMTWGVLQASDGLNRRGDYNYDDAFHYYYYNDYNDVNRQVYKTNIPKRRIYSQNAKKSYRERSWSR